MSCTLEDFIDGFALIIVDYCNSKRKGHGEAEEARDFLQEASTEAVRTYTSRVDTELDSMIRHIKDSGWIGERESHLTYLRQTFFRLKTCYLSAKHTDSDEVWSGFETELKEAYQILQGLNEHAQDVYINEGSGVQVKATLSSTRYTTSVVHRKGDLGVSIDDLTTSLYEKDLSKLSDRLSSAVLTFKVNLMKKTLKEVTDRLSNLETLLGQSRIAQADDFTAQAAEPEIPDWVTALKALKITLSEASNEVDEEVVLDKLKSIQTDLIEVVIQSADYQAEEAKAKQEYLNNSLATLTGNLSAQRDKHTLLSRTVVAQEEKLSLQGARIVDLERKLQTLTDSLEQFKAAQLAPRLPIEPVNVGNEGANSGETSSGLMSMLGLRGRRATPSQEDLATGPQSQPKKAEEFEIPSI